MLTRLWVRDIVLIESADIALGEGLSILTGETGAGKSILLDALGLALGRRGDGALVRAGAGSGSVAASFSLPPHHEARRLAQRSGVSAEAGEPLILRRVQEKAGATRAFVNDQPVGVGLLRDIGESLVDILGQNDVRGLLDPRRHRAALDAFGDLQPAIDKVRTAHAPMRELHAVLQESATGAGLQARLQAELDELDARLQEFERLAPAAGEEAALAQERSLLMQASSLGEELEQTAATLNAPDDGLEERLGSLLRRLARMSARLQAPPTQLEAAAAALERALPEVAEARASLDALLQALEADPERLDTVEQRLFALRSLARRHETDCDQLPAVLEALQTRRSAVVEEMQRAAGLQADYARARAEYDKAADALTEARREAAKRLDAAVAAEIKGLRLGQMTFRTLISRRPDDAGADGRDLVNFEVAPEAETDFGALARIASGGELSRFMLAVQAAIFGRKRSAPTSRRGKGKPAADASAPGAAAPVCLIFDEIDQGVGGAVADAVGARLQRLARSAQVLVVTHAPQIAARAEHHFRVSRSPSGKGRKPIAAVAPLDKASQREEIARMLAGASVSEEARAAATRLLDG